MTINKENIQQVIDLMKGDDTVRFRMATYICSVNDRATDSDGEWCGTSACIAGYASVALNGAQEARKIEVQHPGKTATIGREFFGLSMIQARLLFVPSLTMLTTITRDEAITVLENLRDTGKVDWTVAGYGNRYHEDNYIL